MSESTAVWSVAEAKARLSEVIDRALIPALMTMVAVVGVKS